LYNLTTYNSINNIIAGENNLIRFVIPPASKEKEKEEEIIIPEGSYEIAQLGDYLTKKLGEKKITFSLKINQNTMRVEMETSHKVIFPPKSIRRILGFQKKSYDAGTHTSELIPEISEINCINVECNLIDGGSFRNGKRCHNLFSFTPQVEPGYKIVERPANMLFLPVRSREISNITLRLTDQSRKLVHFSNEEVTIHLVLREL